MEQKIQKTISLIKKADKIGFITHRDGDGDAFGSMLALSKVLKDAGKKTVIFSNEPLLKSLDFLKEKIEYNPKAEYQKIDLLIGLDANTVDRFTVPKIFHEAKKDGAEILVIDHHIPLKLTNELDNYWGDTEISCVSEMVFNLLKKMNQKIDKVVATLLLLGIQTDTLSLQFSNTSPETFNVVAELIKMGARLKSVAESVFGGRPISQVKMLGRIIERLELDEKSGLATSYIAFSDVVELRLTEQASSGVANFLEQVKGTKIIAVFEEREPNKFKVSLRSNNSDLDVSKIAEEFDGGGHKKAAGFRTEGNLEDVMGEAKKKLLTLAK